MIKATTLMRINHYGWFDRQAKGIYALSPKGQDALDGHAEEISRLKAASNLDF